MLHVGHLDPKCVCLDTLIEAAVLGHAGDRYSSGSLVQIAQATFVFLGSL